MGKRKTKEKKHKSDVSTQYRISEDDLAASIHSSGLAIEPASKPILKVKADEPTVRSHWDDGISHTKPTKVCGVMGGFDRNEYAVKLNSRGVDPLEILKLTHVNADFLIRLVNADGYLADRIRQADADRRGGRLWTA